MKEAAWAHSNWIKLNQNAQRPIPVDSCIDTLVSMQSLCHTTSAHFLFFLLLSFLFLYHCQHQSDFLLRKCHRAISSTWNQGMLLKASVSWIIHQCIRTSMTCNWLLLCNVGWQALILILHRRWDGKMKAKHPRNPSEKSWHCFAMKHYKWTSYKYW